MSRRSLLALLAIPVFFLAAIPAAFAKQATTSAAPVVTSIKPLKLKIGEKLTIHGKNFIKGKHKDTIVFMGAGKRVVWVKADTASKNTITVKLPTRLGVLLADKTGKEQATRLLIRVIAKKSARAFTKRSKSPIVSPNAILPNTPQAEACPGVSNAAGDSDGDLLPNGLELALGTNPCSADSDGDGVSDGYEYQSALDLNRTAGTSTIPWPYPGKRPYPNPLDRTDANVDFDGDGLTLSEEYLGSLKLGFSNLSQVHYSDGKQMTVVTPAPAADGYEDDDGTPGPSAGDTPRYHNDYNGDGFLSDDEQDADGDGLSNWAETKGFATESWWVAWDPSKKPNGEHPYKLRPFGVLDWLNPDTDGDGVPDGADDQDQDGLTNLQEQARNFVFNSGEPYDRRMAINPFNPCLPNPSSPACTKYIPFGTSITPFETDSAPLPDALFPDFPAPYSWPNWWVSQS